VIARAIACLLVIAVLVAQVAAQPASVMVLPIDGTADPALRGKLTTALETAVTDLGSVKPGTTTLAETAVAIGCDPAVPACAETVRSTLSVDILIFGNATPTELVVTKVEKGKPAITATQPLSPSGELDAAAIRTITGKPAAPATCSGEAMPQADGTCLARPKAKPRTERVIGISLLVGAGLLMLGGVTQWSAKSKKQDQIDAAPTATLADFQALQALEDDAASKATTGNLLVLGALALTATGIWLLRRDRKAHRELSITPTVTPTSAGVLLTIGVR
jgi:hypothetical protein